MSTNRSIQSNSLFSEFESINKTEPVQCYARKQQIHIDDDEHDLLNGLIILVACPITERVSPPPPCIITDTTWLFGDKKESLCHHHQFPIKKWDRCAL